MSAMRTISGLALLLALTASPAYTQERPSAKPLTIYYIDTEGGQSTLFVAPTGESLLVDAGNPGGRDTDRIMLALADAGVKQIDHFVLTHYHVDHFGGLEALAARVPIKHFYDHGPNSEARPQNQASQDAYAAIYAKGAAHGGEAWR
jgi:competence protein ComEC